MQLGISLQSAIKKKLFLFYNMTFDLDMIRTQIEFHSKVYMLQCMTPKVKPKKVLSKDFSRFSTSLTTARFGYGLTSIFPGESKKNNFMDFGGI